MSLQELRKSIIAQLRTTEDAELLREVERMLDAGDAGQPVYQTTPEQRLALENSIKNVREGKVVSAKEADKSIRRSLGKKTSPK